MANSNSVIPHIIEQHAEEAAFLWLLRDRAVSAPHYSLKDLAKLDGRVEAHIDGLRIAGDYGWQVVQTNLAAKESGEVFAAGVLALEGNEIDRLNLLYDAVEECPETVRGLISAFGWVDPQHLRGKVNGLLMSQNPFRREVGIAACAIHRVDPGRFLEQSLSDDDLSLKARAARTAGELGRVDLKSVLLDWIGHPDAGVGFWSAWSAVLLGDRGKGLHSLRSRIVDGAEFSMPALNLVLRVLEPSQVKELLTVLATHDDRIREAVAGAGITGDPAYLPWLIKQMEVPKLAKVAGESFSFITGVDIAYHDLEGELPKDFGTGPTENPEDDNVAMDPDEDLPVPDPILIDRWWRQHQQDFQIHVRHLSGRPVNRASCQEVLKTGKQRQRRAAALELALVSPEAPLFETRAVGKKQQSRLSSQ
jgi:uncharacterized protein (TIGR02270 family)